jgi:hypothetical protein
MSPKSIKSTNQENPPASDGKHINSHWFPVQDGTPAEVD